MKVRCDHCGYEWETSSDKIFVSCPSCLKKTKIIIEDLEKEKDEEIY